MVDKERYATIGTWVKVFQSEEQLISAATIRDKLNEAGIIGETARSRIGHVILQGFYAESDVRRVCQDFFNRLDIEYFACPDNIRHDLAAYGRQLGEDKTPIDLSANLLIALSATCHNGETVRGEAYLKKSAVALGIAKDDKEASSKKAETFRLLLKIAGFNVRVNTYYQTSAFVLHDLSAYVDQLDEVQSPLGLHTGNIAPLSITCHNGETVKGQTYLKNAAVALGFAKNDDEANPKMAETLRFLLKTAGIEIRDTIYYETTAFVLHDLVAFACQLGEDKAPCDLSVNSICSLSITCHNGETAKGQAYLKNAAVALGLAKAAREAGPKKVETLRKLKEIAGLKR